jgi:hypothetical protein
MLVPTLGELSPTLSSLLRAPLRLERSIAAADFSRPMRALGAKIARAAAATRPAS